MKYFSVESVKNSPELRRTGKVVYADKYKKDAEGNGFAFLQCNGRRVFLPYRDLTEAQIKSLYVSRPVSFLLSTDGERVWASGIEFPGAATKKYLFRDEPLAPEDIPVRRIKKISISNMFYRLPEEERGLSDGRHIPRNLYECIFIQTTSNIYCIYGKNAPVKGFFHVDDIYGYIDRIYMKLGIGHYEKPINDIECREREEKEKQRKEQLEEKKKQLKCELQIEVKIKDPATGFERHIIQVKPGIYAVSYSDIPHADFDEAEYTGISTEKYRELAKEHGAVWDMENGKRLGEFISVATFQGLSFAMGFARRLALYEYEREMDVTA